MISNWTTDIGYNKQYSEKELIKIVGMTLKQIAANANMGLDYITICACALEILDNALGEEYDFPVDIERIVEFYGIDVFYQPLNIISGRMNERSHKVVGRNLKRINRVTNQSESYILIDDESRYEEQRYALAHELAHYLIHIEDRKFNSEYCVMPMLFKKMEEMVADIFAIFLLIPLPIFLKEFSAYMGNQSVPAKTSEWLKYLSRVTEVPYEDVAIGYQNIRYVCGIIYNEMQNGMVISNNDKDINMILQKQCRKIKDVLKEDVVERLYC